MGVGARVLLSTAVLFWFASLITEIIFNFVVLSAQNEIEESFKPELKGLDFTTCKHKHEDGLSFLNRENISIPWDLFDKLAKRICDITRPLAQSGEAEVENFLKLLSENSVCYMI